VQAVRVKILIEEQKRHSFRIMVMRSSKDLMKRANLSLEQVQTAGSVVQTACR